MSNLIKTPIIPLYTPSPVYRLYVISSNCNIIVCQYRVSIYLSRYMKIYSNYPTGVDTPVWGNCYIF